MPQGGGRIDRIKSEAMLGAAVQVIVEQGMAAPVAEIARRAGVSKQTLYNHFGGKAGLIRVLIMRRVDQFAAPLADPGGQAPPLDALTAFARLVAPALLAEPHLALLRTAIQGGTDIPDLARTAYQTGSEAILARLVDYLRAETRAGRLAVPDAEQAAELFVGMLAARQTRALMGLPPEADSGDLNARCAEVAGRFVRAYSP